MGFLFLFIWEIHGVPHFSLKYEGVQKVCGPTMKEKRYKGHSMYVNTTSQYNNIYQEKRKQIHWLFLHAILEVAYLQTQKILKLQK